MSYGKLFSFQSFILLNCFVHLDFLTGEQYFMNVCAYLFVYRMKRGTPTLYDLF